MNKLYNLKGKQYIYTQDKGTVRQYNTKQKQNYI